MRDIPKKIIKYKIVLTVIVAIFAFYLFLIRTPGDFPANILVEVRKGSTVGDVAEELGRNSLIRSPFLFKLLVTVVAPRTGIIAGDYYFKEAENIFQIVGEMTDKIFGKSNVRVTIPEGMNNKQVANLLANYFDNFDKKAFLVAAKDYEGMLFPDTYIFSKSADLTDLIRAMNDNFKKKLLSVSVAINASGRSTSDIIKMASIIEEETNNQEARTIVSGILWNRINRGMPLQVDAPFYYLYGKPSSALSLADLKIDNPYNLYVYKGLPPTPISNPGILSIIAAATPKRTSYMFYLSDKKGGMHYAVTFAEHVANKAKYLR